MRAAFSGVQAKEVHVCGEPAAERVLKSLVKATGDELEVGKNDLKVSLKGREAKMANPS